MWESVGAAEFCSVWASPESSFRICSAPPPVGSVRYSKPPAALAGYFPSSLGESEFFSNLLSLFGRRVD